MNKICYGCGVKIQHTDKKALGYVPEDKKDATPYCMRCFRMIHYGENPETGVPKDKKEIIRKINNDSKFVIFLVDFLNINQEIMDVYNSIKGKKVLIINKCELIPKSVNKDAFLSFVREYYKVNTLIKLKGGDKSRGASSIHKYLVDNKIKEAYILGLSNSGKSTLINDLIDIYGSKAAKITVNKHANTTLDFIRVKINENLTVVDSPGFVMDATLDNDVTGKTITAYSMNMKECQTASIVDEKYHMKFDASTPIVFYTNVSAKLVIKKFYKEAPNLVHTIKIDECNKDIVIKGLGFINVKKPVTITTNIDLKYIEVRDSMFGANHE